MVYVQKAISVAKDTLFLTGVPMEVIKMKKARRTVNHAQLDMSVLPRLPLSMTLSVRLGGIVQ